MQNGVVFNIQRYSLQDGPGIRSTVFLKGCPLCCWWCHNPEGRSPQPELLVVESRCLACGQCREACPFRDCLEGAGPLPAQPEFCTLCAACVEACPTGARQLAGRTMSVAEVMDEILQDRIFYDGSGGGVSFSGGEPFLQADFLLALLEACCRREIDTTVDTCGFAPPDKLLAAAALTDLFLYDLKFMDEAKHLQYTGVSNAPILENLRALSQVHRNIWVRVPIIPGLNDQDQELEAIAKFAASLAGVRQVSLLPYHKIGIQKFQRIGQDYRLKHVQPPSPVELEQAARIFAGFGLITRVGV